MDLDFVDHAERVLEAEPSHSLCAGVLYRRAGTGSKPAMSLHRFIGELRRRPHRFAVVTPASLIDDGADWTFEERKDYALALNRAGDAEPIITLAVREPGAFYDPLQQHRTSDNSVLGDVHDALSQLLESAAEDDTDMRGAITYAVGELQAVARVLE